ncbi:MAG: hypothetical protein P1U69_10560 [Parvibaculaceae bacterium]|nr:hypothetical protein [Parvibaculaceae bacterium]HBM88030.1 hypothetical protein [Rhodobiaceae bacterium]
MFKFQVGSLITGAALGVLAVWLLISAPDWATRYLANADAHPTGIDSFRFVGSWMVIVALLLLAAGIVPPTPSSQRMLALAMTLGLAVVTAVHVQVQLSEGTAERWLPPLKMDTAFFTALTLYWTVVTWVTWRAAE